MLCILIYSNVLATSLPAWFPKVVKLKAEFLVNSNKHHERSSESSGSNEKGKIGSCNCMNDRERNRISLTNRRNRVRRDKGQKHDILLDLRGGSTDEITEVKNEEKEGSQQSGVDAVFLPCDHAFLWSPA